MLWAHLNVCVRSVSCPSPALHHDFTMFLLDAFGCAGLPVHSPKSIFAWGGLKHRESLNKLCCPRVVGRRPWALASPGAAVQALYLGLCSVLAHGDTVAWPGMLGMVLWHHGGAAGTLMVAVGCEELGGAAGEPSRSHLGSTGGEPAQGRRPCPCSMDPSFSLCSMASGLTRDSRAYPPAALQLVAGAEGKSGVCLQTPNRAPAFTVVLCSSCVSARNDLLMFWFYRV